MANKLRFTASLPPSGQAKWHQLWRKYQIKSRAAIRREKPRTACHSWFFLYCAKEKTAEDSPDNLAGRKLGRNNGTAREYSSKAAPCCSCNSFSSRRITMK